MLRVVEHTNRKDSAMKKLFVIVITAFVMTVGLGSTAAPARATGGSGSSVITCPSYKPYLRINAFGAPFCSAYP
jgi:hypothetical protein